jgi:hypothetical protein
MAKSSRNCCRRDSYLLKVKGYGDGSWGRGEQGGREAGVYRKRGKRREYYGRKGRGIDRA